MYRIQAYSITKSVALEPSEGVDVVRIVDVAKTSRRTAAEIAGP